MKISQIISNEGYLLFIIISLIYNILKNGLGDLKVIIKGKEYISSKVILCANNLFFLNTVNDEKFNGVIELDNSCNEIGFKNMEKYYSGGIIDINEDNVIDILTICICYDEEKLIKECVKYYNYF